MKKSFGSALILLLAATAAGQDREKKAYELLYDDVQLLKQQVQRLEKKADQAADDIRLIKDQVRDLLGQFKLFQSEQAKSREGLREVPAQYQALLEKLSQIDALLGRLAEDTASLKSKSPAAEVEEKVPARDERAPNVKKPNDPKTKEPAKKEDPAKEKTAVPAAPPPSNLSPIDVFNTAQADYEKGNYDLAIDGFAMYRESFPASPQADDAVYMIGECGYSQKKFAKAIDSFDDLIMTYPLSNRIAAAYLKKGLSLVELKKKDEAIAVLKFLVAKYPVEDEAKQAQQKLKELQERQ